MPKQCKAENCQYNVFSNKYCRKHQYMRDNAPKQKLNRFSKKRLAINKEQYQPAARQFVKDNPLCNIKSPVCTGHSHCVNHRKGKAGTYLLIDRQYWESSCFACNNWIEANDQWARERGHKLNTFI